MSYKHQLVVGDRKAPLTARLYDDGKDNDLSSATVTFDMYASDGTQVVDGGSCTVQPSVTCTVDATADTLTSPGHGFEEGWEVIAATTANGLSTDTRYYVLNSKPSNFQVALNPEGAPVDLTGSGTIGIKAIGQVQYAFAAGDVDTAGTFKGWFTVTEGGVSDTFPNDSSGIAIVIAEVG